MKVLITGATGFVGKTLIPFLFSKGIREIVLLVRNKDKALMMFANQSIKVISTSSPNWINKVINEDPDVVLHLAAFFTGRHDEDSIGKLLDANLSFTTLLLEALSQTNCKHFINIGTFSEFRNGDGEYHPNNQIGRAHV